MLPLTTLVEKRWNSHPSNVHCAREAVRHAIKNLADPLLIDMIELAIGEACANAVEHGSPHGERSEFVLRCLLCEETELVFEVEDEGAEFSVADLPLHTVLDLYSEGGRGLFLINQIMDHVAIRRTTMGLSVRMTKAMSLG